MPIDEQDLTLEEAPSDTAQAVESVESVESPEAEAAKPADAVDPASIDVSQYPTIDNDWEKLAAEYPDVYERFANTPNDGALDKAMRALVSFEGKLVLDMGAGTGQYAFGFVNEAFKILGMEADEDLLEFDRQVIAEKGYTNIIPFYGLANDLPLNDEVVDIALAVTVAPWDPDPLMRLGLRKRMVEETLRVLKPGGVFIVVTVPEGAYGGELAPVIFDDPALLPNNSDWDAQLVEDFGFQFAEIESVSDYGSVENAVATYGFIFGPNAIRHLLARQQSTITWRYRLLWTQKPGTPASESAPEQEGQAESVNQPATTSDTSDTSDTTEEGSADAGESA